MEANELTFNGWVARDFTGSLTCFVQEDKPSRWFRENRFEWYSHRGEPYTLPVGSFPDLTWEDEPVKVEVTIRRTEE